MRFEHTVLLLGGEGNVEGGRQLFTRAKSYSVLLRKVGVWSNVVLDVYGHILVTRANGYGDRLFLVRVLHNVGEQVLHNSHKLRRICDNGNVLEQGGVLILEVELDIVSLLTKEEYVS